jgi:hypothetical protein
MLFIAFRPQTTREIKKVTSSDRSVPGFATSQLLETTTFATPRKVSHRCCRPTTDETIVWLCIRARLLVVPHSSTVLEGFSPVLKAGIAGCHRKIAFRFTSLNEMKILIAPTRVGPPFVNESSAAL